MIVNASVAACRVLIVPYWLFVSLENGAVAVEVLHLGGLHLIQLDGLCAIKIEILVRHKAGFALGVKLFICICLELGC